MLLYMQYAGSLLRAHLTAPALHHSLASAECDEAKYDAFSFLECIADLKQSLFSCRLHNLMAADAV